MSFGQKERQLDFVSILCYVTAKQINYNFSVNLKFAHFCVTVFELYFFLFRRYKLCRNVKVIFMMKIVNG